MPLYTSHGKTNLRIVNKYPTMFDSKPRQHLRTKLSLASTDLKKRYGTFFEEKIPIHLADNLSAILL